MQLQWRPDLETGDAKVDAQHMDLFEKINDLIVACKEKRERQEIGKLLTFLKQYVRSHFEAESSFQERQRDPLRQAHAAEHESLVLRLTALEKEYVESGASLPVVTNSLKLTYEWLTWHILEWDKKMVG